ncbi:hypothetical protein BZL30_4554 [Mycobacterium kansasii]|uniref:Amidohydrolase 3 domain-containing protein n=1 Tax=Mycobacterium kansasii TaxID=1768 RepID=A0A1V3X2F7_MYCKA|nr:hypothetical protein BZL30_4554 [Mycobacterium kansasii]
MGERGCGGQPPHPGQRRVGAGGVRCGNPRGWRAGGVRDGQAGILAPGAPASYAVWEVDALDVSVPRDAVQRWSTDPRSRVPALPRLGPQDALPRCRQTVHRGAVIHG